MTATRRVVIGDGGVELAVTEWPSPEDRPAVLLVHGYPDTSAMWQPLAERLARRHHVVAYDVRGAGKSAAPRPRSRPSTVPVPVQVIVPLEDRYVSPALSEGLQLWATGGLWRSEVAAGHWLPRTHPDLVATYVSEFVDHVEGGPPSPRLQPDLVPS